MQLLGLHVCIQGGSLTISFSDDECVNRKQIDLQISRLTHLYSEARQETPAFPPSLPPVVVYTSVFRKHHRKPEYRCVNRKRGVKDAKITHLLPNILLLSFVFD